MEKYGVSEKKDVTQNKTATDKKVCPVCGSPLRLHGEVLLCPRCGSKPFEDSDD